MSSFRKLLCSRHQRTCQSKTSDSVCGLQRSTLPLWTAVSYTRRTTATPASVSGNIVGQEQKKEGGKPPWEGDSQGRSDISSSHKSIQSKDFALFRERKNIKTPVCFILYHYSYILKITEKEKNHRKSNFTLGNTLLKCCLCF